MDELKGDPILNEKFRGGIDFWDQNLGGVLKLIPNFWGWLKITEYFCHYMLMSPLKTISFKHFTI